MKNSRFNKPIYTYNDCRAHGDPIRRFDDLHYGDFNQFAKASRKHGVKDMDKKLTIKPSINEPHGDALRLRTNSDY